ncbi:MAG: hypothetical protein HQL28_07130, partial [Candidatus Omnitrophica bacterium]|nr:hypothetical protein [Candidatus Omnitrophota bacterium]
RNGEDRTAEAYRRSEGKSIVNQELAPKPEVTGKELKLLRAITHEEIEALKQVVKWEDVPRYTAIQNLILGYKPAKEKYFDIFPAKTKEALPNDQILNDMLARAFEILVLKKDNLITEAEMTDKEKAFISAIEPVIRDHEHNYFTGVFWNWNLRSNKIREAYARGFRFRQAFSSESEPGASRSSLVVSRSSEEHTVLATSD